MRFPRGGHHRWAVCRRAAEKTGFWTKRVRRMIHPSGGRRGRIIRSSLDYLTQSVKESLYRGSEIRRFTSDPYTPNFSSLVCRSGPPSTKPALGGEGQQSLRILRIFQSSQILRIFQSSHQGPRTLNRCTGRIIVFLYP